MTTLFRPLLSALALALLAGCATVAPTPSPAEAKSLAVLASSADVRDKAQACHDLAVTAGPASIPALVALLDHEQLSDYARSGLEAIPGSAAGQALRDALPRLQGRRLAGVVHSLGIRREAAALPDLRALALDEKRGVAEEAVASLGLLANREAATVLQQVLANGAPALRLPAAHAALVAAERLALDRDSTTARNLLDAVVRAAPSEHVVAVAQTQIAALQRGKSAGRE